MLVSYGISFNLFYLHFCYRLFAHNGHGEEEGRLKDQEQFSINNMHVPDR